MPDTSVFAFGAWRTAKQIFTHFGGNWVEAKEVWVKQGGTWRQVFKRGFTFSATVNGFNYNVYNAAMATGQWDGVTPIAASITVSGNLGSAVGTQNNWAAYLGSNPDVAAAGAGYIVGLTAFAQVHYNTSGHSEGRPLPFNPSTPAFDTGPLPAGSTVTLTVNAGSAILGAGGQGGQGGVAAVKFGNNFPSTAGSPGGPAILAQCPITIVNNGIIAGGGGGGGGGGSGNGGQDYDDPGGAGGGGGGYNPGQGGVAPNGANSTYAGQPGTTLNGGAAGFPSANVSKEWADGRAGGAGGAVGQQGGDGVPGAGGGASFGGPPGSPVVGSGWVSWAVYGDVRGPLA